MQAHKGMDSTELQTILLDRHTKEHREASKALTPMELKVVRDKFVQKMDKPEDVLRESAYKEMTDNLSRHHNVVLSDWNIVSIDDRMVVLDTCFGNVSTDVLANWLRDSHLTQVHNDTDILHLHVSTN